MLSPIKITAVEDPEYTNSVDFKLSNGEPLTVKFEKLYGLNDYQIIFLRGKRHVGYQFTYELDIWSRTYGEERGADNIERFNKMNLWEHYNNLLKEHKEKIHKVFGGKMSYQAFGRELKYYLEPEKYVLQQ